MCSSDLFTPSFNDSDHDLYSKSKGDLTTKSKTRNKTGSKAYLSQTTTAYPDSIVYIILLPESMCVSFDCEPTLTPVVAGSNPRGPAPTDKSESGKKDSKTGSLDFVSKPAKQGKSSSSGTNTILKTTSRVEDKRNGKGAFSLALDGSPGGKAYNENSSKSKSSKSKSSKSKSSKSKSSKSKGMLTYFLDAECRCE